VDALQVGAADVPEVLRFGVLDLEPLQVWVAVVDRDVRCTDAVRLLGEGAGNRRLLGQRLDLHPLPELDVDAHPDDELGVGLQQLFVGLGHPSNLASTPTGFQTRDGDAEG
jgi:hypothetical protein